MKQLLAVTVIIAALLLCGCSLNVPKTGKGNADEDASADAKETVVGIKTGGRESVGGGNVVYENSGVKVTMAGFADDVLTLTAENTSDKELSLRSAYIAADGVALEDRYVSEQLRGGERTDITLSGAGMCRMTMRLFLSEEESNQTVEGSLSDTIEFTFSDKLSLHGKELYTVVYSDDKLKLGLKDVSYRDDSSTVKLKLYAENHTDEDLCILGSDIVCDHEDYYSSLMFFIPAGGRCSPVMRASTTNGTLSAADLDSISFSVRAIPLGDYLADGYYTDDELFKTDTVQLRLPKANRPEKIIPDTVQIGRTADEVRQEMLEDERTVMLPAPQSSDSLSFAGDGIELEYLFGAQAEIGTETYVSLCFRCRNTLQKQITLSPAGVVNGATAGLYCYESVAAMTEDTVTVSCHMPAQYLSSFTDAAVWFEVYYDDGRYDENSYITGTDAFRIVCSDSSAGLTPPKDAKTVYSDDNVEIKYVGIEENDVYSLISFFAVNKSDKNISVSAKVPDDAAENYRIVGKLYMFAGTCTFDTLPVSSSDSGSQLTEKNVGGLGLWFTVTDSEGNELSSGQGVL